jgi:hypothetical protein
LPYHIRGLSYGDSRRIRGAKHQTLDSRMRRTNLSPGVKSVRAPKSSTEGEKMPETRDLLNKGTIQPFKVWHPSRIKTGLRNHPIGRKVS